MMDIEQAVINFERWIAKAKPGESFIYWSGARAYAYVPAPIRHCTAQAQHQGSVCLFQKLSENPPVCDYIAVRISPKTNETLEKYKERFYGEEANQKARGERRIR